jgi:hypothetical protein
MSILHLNKPRQWKALFNSALIALGILVGEGESVRRTFFDPPHAECRGYESAPMVANIREGASGPATLPPLPEFITNWQPTRPPFRFDLYTPTVTTAWL